TLMGIGQGPVAWTPLHAADAYATLARSGLRIVPRLRMDEPLRSINLGLNPRSVAIALEGLSKAVNDERGTGHHITVDWPDGARRENIFTAPGVQVWGKSGTADSGQKARDAQGRLLADDRGQAISLDHAWFVVLAGRAGENRPRYAVAVLVEFGGSGGRIAGPLTNQILLALKAEGYL
ncbi:MAG: penicillin-binding transpeptidase domain-containing protein, partial [Planctomyces sp.]